MKLWIVWVMVVCRALMGPGIVLAAIAGVRGWLLGLIVAAMLVDDIADGMVARRWGFTILQNCGSAIPLPIPCFTWEQQLQPGFAPRAALRANLLFLAILFGLEGARYALDLAKFREAASYHSYMAKVWGLVLATSMICVLTRGGPAWTITAAAVLGIAVNIEGVMMSLILPHWQNDVKTLPMAMRVRAEARKAAAGGC